ncbi:hypothetical protein [Aquimarina sp. MMG016]|uniref:tetratricopeptide repeat protein n=1 Tax=Aquimarina sp. MMG016 TaxID=2822690 RepID=UPI001B39F7C7|nr:hypothetical protein [Aquimarina sp. MMG016]MBQ4819296.1 hypothetical protein [Aquimarina sp. MMG016]
MKEKLNKLSDPNISKQEEDQILEQVLKKQFDNDLRNKWKEKLDHEFGIKRNKNGFTNKKYLKIFIATAASIALIIGLQLFNTTPSDPYVLAQQYLNDQEIIHPGATKGISDENENRVLAIQMFNSKDYEQAASYFLNLEAPTEEDTYYYGLALLLNNQYNKAIVKFEENRTNSSKYIQELNWYQSIAYLLNKQPNKASSLLKQINNTDWNYEQAQLLLERINSK